MQRLDRFGAPPSLNVQGNRTTQTKFGSVITVIVAVCMLGAAVMFCIPLFTRGLPNLVTYTLFYNPTTNFTLNPQQQMFGLFVNGSLQINSTVYNISMTTSTNPTPQLLPTTMYNSSQYNGPVYYIPEVMNIDSQNIIVTYHLNDDLIQSSSLVVLLIYDDIELNPMNYDTPIFQVPLTSTFTGSGGTIQVSFKQINFTSDNGMLFSSEHTQVAIGIDSVQSNDANVTGYFAFTLTKGPATMVYHRSYPKIQDVLAQLSGLFGALVLVLGFLPRLWSRRSATKNLIELTSFRSENDLNNKNNENSGSASEEDSIKIEILDKGDKNKPKKLSFLNKCKTFITKPFQDIKSYKGIEKQIEEQFDVAYLLHKNYQLEALLNFFFTPEERHLFQKLTVPVLESEKRGNNIEFTRKAWWETNDEEEPSLDVLISKLIAKKNKTENEKKLLQIYMNNFKAKTE